MLVAQNRGTAASLFNRASEALLCECRKCPYMALWQLHWDLQASGTPPFKDMLSSSNCVKG